MDTCVQVCSETRAGSSSVTTAQPGPGDEAVPLMHWLDFGGLGGLQPKLCSEKPKLQDSNSTVGPGAAWPGLAWLVGIQTKRHFTAALLPVVPVEEPGPQQECVQGVGIRAVADVAVVADVPWGMVGHSWAEGALVPGCHRELHLLSWCSCSPPRSQTPQDSHRALEIESHSSGEKNSFQVRSSPPLPPCALGITGEAAEAGASTAHSNPG